MQFILVVHQSAPKSGAFSANSDAILETLREARRRAPDAPLVLFAPRCAIEGMEGRSALESDCIRAARDAAIEKLQAEARILKAHIFLPIETDRGPVALVLGRRSGPAAMRAGEAPSELASDVCPRVSVDPSDKPILLWDPFRVSEPFSAMPPAQTPPEGAALVSPTLGGCEAGRACAGGSLVRFGSAEYAARRYEPDALLFVCGTQGGRLSEVSAPLRVLNSPVRSASLPADERLAAIIAAIRDYVLAVRSEGVVLGISGGVDSALVAACAAEALGADRVRALFLASRFSSLESHTLAHRLADALGIRLADRSIEAMHEAACSDFADDIGQLPVGDIADQNIQARLRSLRLMAIANKENRILLCTANKSEAAMGYGTLYGDLSGGFAPIVDLWKSEVIACCRAFNAWKGAEVIPEAIIQREPTAELRPGQKDSDSLPPYADIERVMRAALRSDFEPKEFADSELSIVKAAARFAFKRMQCALGLRLSETTMGDFDQRFGINRTLEWR